MIQEGKNYKWNIENKIYVLNLGSLLDNYQSKYDPILHKLSIKNTEYEDEIFYFKCFTLEDAEVIVKAFSLGMNVDIMLSSKI